jgi:hypothetical protein
MYVSRYVLCVIMLTLNIFRSEFWLARHYSMLWMTNSVLLPLPSKVSMTIRRRSKATWQEGIQMESQRCTSKMDNMDTKYLNKTTANFKYVGHDKSRRRRPNALIQN